MGYIYGSDIQGWFNRINGIRAKIGWGGIGYNPVGQIASASHMNDVINNVNALYTSYWAYASKPGAMSAVSAGQIISQQTANDVNARLAALERVCANHVVHGTSANRPGYSTGYGVTIHGNYSTTANVVYNSNGCANFGSNGCANNGANGCANNGANGCANNGANGCKTCSNNSQCATKNTFRGGSNFTNTTACTKCSKNSTFNGNHSTFHANHGTFHANHGTSHGNHGTFHGNHATRNYTAVYDFAVTG